MIHLKTHRGTNVTMYLLTIWNHEIIKIELNDFKCKYIFKRTGHETNYSVNQSNKQGQSNQLINLRNQLKPNQSNQSIKTADETSASPYIFAVFLKSEL